jgi:hypothetical protein
VRIIAGLRVPVKLAYIAMQRAKNNIKQRNIAASTLDCGIDNAYISSKSLLTALAFPGTFRSPLHTSGTGIAARF